jgi:hypothetical protein
MKLAAFLMLVSFGYVFLKAMQQRNVVGNHFLFLGPVSYGMALCEVYGISAWVQHPEQKLLAVGAIGTGAWLGCVLAMKLHNKLFATRQ